MRSRSTIAAEMRASCEALTSLASTPKRPPMRKPNYRYSVHRRVASRSNITPAMKRAFSALTKCSVTGARFALLSCFVNGEPSAAITYLEEERDRVTLYTLFIVPTASMVITDHDGTQASSRDAGEEAQP
jgi:hypothetical protein